MNTSKAAARRGETKREATDPRRVDHEALRALARRQTAQQAKEAGKSILARLAGRLGMPLGDMVKRWTAAATNRLLARHGRSTWKPHQGAQECARRREQLLGGKLYCQRTAARHRERVYKALSYSMERLSSDWYVDQDEERRTILRRYPGPKRPRSYRQRLVS